MNKKLILFLGIFSLFFIFGFKNQKYIFNQKNIAVNFERVEKLEKEIEKVDENKNLDTDKKEIQKEDKEELALHSKKNSEKIKEIDLRTLSSNERKQAFVDMLLPAINEVHEQIKENKSIVEKLAVKTELTPEEKEFCEALFSKYKVEYGNWKELQGKMVIYPASLILTQGALESAWGTSRFFREGKNIFGMWSTNPNEPRIAAKGVRENGFIPHLRKYDSIEESVEDIVMTISVSDAYKTVRKLLHEEKSPREVAYGLIKYSEEGPKYVEKVQKTLEYNDFEKYDI
ncbi:MAG: glucosaminidase domain-containing protein [Fusobacterium sp.]|nr:glucosaminidase domain-containing protein [Fusobacterium sp.]